MKISFIGFGKFAKMMAAGLKSEPTLQLHAAAPSLTPGVQHDGVLTEIENIQVVKNADCIILAVKPFQAREVLLEIGPYLPPQSILVSVVTGVEIETLLACCRPEQPIVRAMPNSPIAVKQGMTALFKNEFVSLSHVQTVEFLFGILGRYSWVKVESDIDRLTALSGSGPAYVFLFLEALVAGARDLGLSEEVAQSFAFEMVLGSVILAKNSQISLRKLREGVTSPGGTTQAALNVLEKGQFESLIKEAVRVAFIRAQALSKSS